MNKNNNVFISFYCLLSSTCLLLSVWGLTPLLAVSSQSFKDLPGCHNQCFPQIFASNWQLSHLVSGRRQVTSQCQNNIPLKIFGRDNKIWKPITKICIQTESLSVYYVYLKVTKGHNSISSWCSATKPGVSRPHMQVHILVKWQ